MVNCCHLMLKTLRHFVKPQQQREQLWKQNCCLQMLLCAQRIRRASKPVETTALPLLTTVSAPAAPASHLVVIPTSVATCFPPTSHTFAALAWAVIQYAIHTIPVSSDLESNRRVADSNTKRPPFVCNVYIGCSGHSWGVFTSKHS